MHLGIWRKAECTAEHMMKRVSSAKCISRHKAIVTGLTIGARRARTYAQLH